MLLKFKFFVGVALMLGITTSCKQEKSNPNKEILVEIPSDFEDFYKKFHSDSLYQLDHIIFPLAGKLNDFGEPDFWNKEEWKLHKSFDQSYSNYKRDFSVFGDIVTEKILDTFSAFYMERRFAKVTGDWNLIHYRVEYNVPESVISPD